jgi:hypothetical protein
MIEESNEKLVVLLYTLNSGLQRTANLSRQQVKEFIEHYKNENKYVCTSYNETYGFNPDLIADFKVIDLYQKEIPIHKIISEPVNEVLETKTEDEALTEDALKIEYSSKLTPFKIDCKCGRMYTVMISSNTNFGSCNNCHERVFVDRNIGEIETHKGKGWLMTNKYFVKTELTYKISEK